MELEESLVDAMLTLHLVQCLHRVAVTEISVKAGTMNGGLGSSEVVLPDVNRMIGNDSRHCYPLLS